MDNPVADAIRDLCEIIDDLEGEIRMLRIGQRERDRRLRVMTQRFSEANLSALSLAEDNERLRKAMADCLATYYLDGGSRVVCPNDLILHLRTFSQLLKESERANDHGKTE
jgi:hypothetical protein